MFGYEVEVIDQAHGLLQPRVEQRAGGFEPDDTRAEGEAGLAESGEDFPDVFGVVVGFVSFAVGQIRGREGLTFSEEVFDPCGPERFHVEQVSGVFLRGPFAAGLLGEFAALRYFFEARGRAAQADADIGVLIGGKVEIEFPFKPLGHRQQFSHRNDVS